jgi:2-(1,2-epoxy-1,2-dihydrophenyl)acetyl-CoA isomerase
MVEGLNAVVDAAGADERVRVVVLRGAGDDFCVGVAAPAPGRTGAAERPRVGTLTRRLPQESHRLVASLLALQTPVVGVVRGRAHHAGLALALAADVTVVAADADLRAGFLPRAATPDAGLTWMLPRRVGEVRARELLLLDRALTGEEAAAWGMVHAAVAAPELEAEVGLVVERLGASATVALGLTKWLTHRGRAARLEDQLRDEAFGLELSARSEDFREGLAALRERRPPEFRGR